jgi:transposase
MAQLLSDFKSHRHSRALKPPTAIRSQQQTPPTDTYTASICAFFRRWRDNALVKEFHDRLRARVREELGRDAQPTARVIDSQSVKADAVVGTDSRGFDGGKLVNGRKRHVVVDTLGLLLGVMVTAADIGDRTAALVLLEEVAEAHHRLALIWADGGYTGSLVEYRLATVALVLAIVKRSNDQKGFVVLPRRWIVERIFAHLMRSRLLVRDFGRGGDGLLVDDPAHDPSPGPVTPAARMNRLPARGRLRASSPPQGCRAGAPVRPSSART